ncbi:hypothetical protein [Halobacillus seohaensis]|uniref:Antigen I/II N-terminal domain-containing protein n=1 Tax=Halobacillus seohaensis TaxID=447421 RepID=A0ABW2ELT3_9BACI
MKKFTILIFVLILSLLAACSSDESGNDTTEEPSTSAEGENTEEKTENEKDGEKVEVDKGLLNVEVTLPASMVEGQNMDQITAEAKEQGVKEVTQNDNGSVTYKMSKSAHKEMLKETKKGVVESVEEVKNSGDYSSVQDITYNDNFTEFTMVVDQKKYENSMDGFATMTLGMSGMMYQVFEGKGEDEYSVNITIENTSGEEFDEVKYPEAIEQMENNSQ